MRSELFNLWLFALAIAKASVMTGLAAAPLLALLQRMRGGFWSPVTIGKRYRVEGHYLGDFIAEIEDIDRDLARVRIVDPLRPLPRVKNRCPFPQCVIEEFHGGDHEFCSVREGALLEIHWRTAKSIPIAEDAPQKVSGAGQSAGVAEVSLPTRMPSPSRKEWRRA